MALRVEGGRRYVAMNAAARGISEIALGWHRNDRRARARAKGKERERTENSAIRRVPRELRIAPRGVALFMTAIDHRPASRTVANTPLIAI